MPKSCAKCLIEQNESCFHKDKSKKDDLTAVCKTCKLAYAYSYRNSNKDKIKQSQKTHYLNNKESINLKNRQKRAKNLEKYRLDERLSYLKNPKIKQVSAKKWRGKNRVIINRINQELKLKNPLYKLSCNLRSRLNLILKSKKWNKTNKLKDILGCNQEIFIKHIESKFQSGMTWENHGKFTWHIDRVIPLSSAKNPEELYKLNHYTNLQPLWAKQNLRKHNKCQQS